MLTSCESFDQLLGKMSRNYNQRLSDAIERAYGGLDAPPDPSLLSELEELRAAFEDIGGDWEEPIDSLRADFEELDDNFGLATDEYMRVCDLLEEGAISRDEEILEEAERAFRKAQILLRAADEAAKARFAQWTRKSET